VEVETLFRELGIITGSDENKRLIYEETALCQDPMERLFHYGEWREGIVPQYGLTAEEALESRRFLTFASSLKSQRGVDGLRAFAIPIERSSKDPAWVSLDQLTFADWLDANGYRSPPLRWYLDYCCRDDFGAGTKDVSAWAGLHYFAARNGEAANAPPYAVVTWPSGNGWLVSQLADRIRVQIQTGAAVFGLGVDPQGIHVDFFETTSNQSVRCRAEHVVFAVPEFISRRILTTLGDPSLKPIPEASRVRVPWIVANLTLKGLPTAQGTQLAWDNVLYNSPGLGYVVATHQSLVSHPQRTVLTYYRPLDHLEPNIARQEALNRSHADWCELVLSDLAKPHPKLREQLVQMDIQVWGHGMALPAPGFLAGLGKPPFSSLPSNFHFAHADLSGMSLFDEAYIRGVQTANSIARALGPRS
jgi:hypothetical protein